MTGVGSVTSDGNVVCWVENRLSQARPPAREFASLSTREEHTCGVRTDGTVACWGEQVRGIAAPVSSKLKMGESSKMELTHPMVSRAMGWAR